MKLFRWNYIARLFLRPSRFKIQIKQILKQQQQQQQWIEILANPYMFEGL